MSFWRRNWTFHTAMLCLLGLAAAAAWASFTQPTLGTRPAVAEKYRSLIVRTARFMHKSLDAPVPLYGSQVLQESAFNPKAQSKYAAGLGQQTPDTADWIAMRFKGMKPADVFNPGWSVRAMMHQMLFLRERIPAVSECDQYAMMLAAYNGGYGNHRKDVRLTKARGDDPLKWFGGLEPHTSRAAWAYEENREYPRRILFRQALFLDWGGSVVECPDVFPPMAEQIKHIS